VGHRGQEGLAGIECRLELPIDAGDLAFADHSLNHRSADGEVDLLQGDCDDAERNTGRGDVFELHAGVVASEHRGAHDSEL
jgi:hypothetical protein